MDMPVLSGNNNTQFKHCYQTGQFIMSSTYLETKNKSTISVKTLKSNNKKLIIKKLYYFWQLGIINHKLIDPIKSTSVCGCYTCVHNYT